MLCRDRDGNCYSTRAGRYAGAAGLWRLPGTADRTNPQAADHISSTGSDPAIFAVLACLATHAAASNSECAFTRLGESHACLCFRRTPFLLIGPSPTYISTPRGTQRFDEARPFSLPVASGRATPLCGIRTISRTPKLVAAVAANSVPGLSPGWVAICDLSKVRLCLYVELTHGLSPRMDAVFR